MKARFIFLFFGCLSGLGLFNISYGQSEAQIIAVDWKRFPETIGICDNTNGTVINSVERLNTKNLKKAGNVNIKVMREFMTSFKNAIDTQWYAFDNKGKYFLVTFFTDGRESRALYRKDGYLSYAISIGSEKDLPAEDRKRLKSFYVDYEIVWLVEIMAAYKTSWIVNLREGDNLVIVRLEDDVAEEVAHYKVKSVNIAANK